MSNKNMLVDKFYVFVIIVVGVVIFISIPSAFNDGEESIVDWILHFLGNFFINGIIGFLILIGLKKMLRK